MPHNTSRSDIIAQRRENVARMRLRGFSQREIVAALPKLNPPVLNGDKPFSVFTINTDLKALSAEWRLRAAEDIDTRKARQLAEIDEARRRAWADGDLANLARFIKLESDIFGTMAAIKVEVNDLREKADSELISEFNQLVASGAAATR